MQISNAPCLAMQSEFELQKDLLVVPKRTPLLTLTSSSNTSIQRPA